MKRWLVSGLFSVMVVLVGFTSLHAAYEGRVVDAETKEPIEGAVVFMEWSYLEFSLMPHSHKYADYYETLTDKEGRFSLPQWWSFNPWKMLYADSIVTIFKGAYKTVGGGSWHSLMSVEWGAPGGTYIWKREDGKPVILLHKITGRKERRRNLVYPPAEAPPEKKIF